MTPEIDTRLESKLGFDRIRSLIADHCSTDYASQRVAVEPFISDPAAIRRRLLLTDEMRLIVMFEEIFPTNGYIDCLPFLTPLLKEGFFAYHHYHYQRKQYGNGVNNSCHRVSGC
jgi:DNA mismatch repair protein MutS2